MMAIRSSSLMALITMLALATQGVQGDGVLVKCSNPYGNPCGPGNPCTDTPTGFTCEILTSKYRCPMPCSQNEHCILGDSQLYYCECIPGYYRPKPYLHCVVPIATASNVNS